MLTQAIRRTMLFVALAALPGFAAAAGSRAGDNGRQPLGADNDSPRQAIPNAMTNDGTLYYYDGPVYYGPRYYVSPYYAVPPYFAPTYDQSDLSFCDRQPLAERAACRDAAVAYDYRYSPEYRYYPEHRYYYPGDTSTRNTNTINRCLALSGPARVDCLKGGAPGG